MVLGGEEVCRGWEWHSERGKGMELAKKERIELVEGEGSAVRGGRRRVDNEQGGKGRPNQQAKAATSWIGGDGGLGEIAVRERVGERENWVKGLKKRVGSETKKRG